MKFFKIFYFILLLIPVTLIGQEEKKTVHTQKVLNPPKIDGFLDDESWKNAEITTGFIQQEPIPGIPASQKTEIKVVYTDNSIFIGAHLFDSSPDSILHQFTQRDEEGNSDLFGFWLSPFKDGNNAFFFVVTPEGVQIDIKASTNDFDYSWNAVWKSSARIVDDGWIAEIEIPYSAIRFSSKEEQDWDINFTRTIRRHREQSFWSEVSPDVDNFLIFRGEIKGLKNIEPPLRLFFYPYASSYYSFTKNTEGSGYIDGTSFNAGMDLKYGINDAFTLDLTLIPDFGQVQSDNLILNLSAFEVAFDENRQFFNEGTELFNKGNIFYSRRIGGSSINEYYLEDGEEFIEGPKAVQLLNATKISGRNNKGLGVGFLNAITKINTVRVRDSLGVEREIETSPLTNYNIFVLDQNLKNNSYISLINTNVVRSGDTYDANVIATEFQLNNKKNTYSIEGNLKYNKKFDNHYDREDEGYAYSFEAGKTRGNFQYYLGTNVESKYYDPNDFGFLSSPNEISYSIDLYYNIYEPFWKGKMNRMWSAIWTGYQTLYDEKKFTGHWVGGNIGMLTKNFFSFGTEFNINPRKNPDYFEPRVDGRHYKRHENINYGVWISSDYRKKFALDLSHYLNDSYKNRSKIRFYRFAPRVRVNDHLEFSYVYAFRKVFNGEGYTFVSDNEEDIIFAKRDLNTHTNVLSSKYIINNKMGITLRLRHYWSTVKNHSFHYLNEFGELSEEEYDGFLEDGTSEYNRSFNTFNADMVYTWVFAPGSELSLVWKATLDNEEFIIPTSFEGNFNDTFSLPKNNSISLKILYFIDYNLLKKKNN